MFKNIRFLIFTSLALLVFSSVAGAEVITTGSETADTWLQWFTSIVTLASLVSNFTGAPTEAKGIFRVVAVLVNLLAANLKPIKDAWTGPPPAAALVALALGSLLLFGMVPPANAVTAPTPTASVVKAGFSWAYPTTRTDGYTLALSQIKQINLYVSSLAAVIVVPAPATSYSYVLPAGVCIKTTDIVQATATDTDGLESAASDKAVISGDMCGPKPAPAAPTNVKVTQL